MDAIAGLLDGPRARRAFLLRCGMNPPWALHIRDEAPLSLVAMLRGRACFVVDGQEPTWLDSGDVAILLGPEHYLFADDPATPPQAIIHPDQRCTTPDGQEIPQMRSFGVRRWGNAAEWRSPVPDLLAAEMLRDEPGQDAVLDRLLDLLLIDAVRTHLDRAQQAAPGWYRARHDPVVARALRLLQESPAEPWTIETLARQAGVSRATLARRFADVVGQPPMEFLTQWRITLAADLILDPRQTVGSVARAVGYSSPYALSAAFKRVRGTSPHQHRTAQRLPVASP
jgi:AraC-like DNA-binding protein